MAIKSGCQYLPMLLSANIKPCCRCLLHEARIGCILSDGSGLLYTLPSECSPKLRADCPPGDIRGQTSGCALPRGAKPHIIAPNDCNVHTHTAMSTFILQYAHFRCVFADVLVIIAAAVVGSIWLLDVPWLVVSLSSLLLLAILARFVLFTSK